MRKSKLYYFFINAILAIVLLTACEKPTPEPIPPVYMDATINIDTDVEFVSLQSPGSSFKISRHPQGITTIGYDNNGIIVYHNEFRKVFYVFDATCPHDMPESVSLNVDGAKAICPQCGSVYLLPSEGIPTEDSPSRHFLKQYRSVFYSSGDLKIFN